MSGCVQKHQNNNKNNITYNTKFATNNHKTQEYVIYITVNKVI